MIDNRTAYEHWVLWGDDIYDEDKPSGIAIGVELWGKHNGHDRDYCCFVSNRPHMLTGSIVEETSEGLIWDWKDKDGHNGTIRFRKLTLERLKTFWLNNGLAHLKNINHEDGIHEWFRQNVLDGPYV